MTAKDIVIKRTGMSAEDAEFYVAMAEARVRAYLHLDNDADLSAYVFAVADIAVLYWQKDTSTQNSAAVLGYTSSSFSEGGVSRSNAGMTGAAIQSTYDAAIDDVLAGLNGAGGLVVFL